MDTASSSAVALVTGASSGIGAATVRALRRHGMIVYAAARRVDRMQSLASEGARVLSLDLTDDASMVAAMQRIERDAGRLDVLVNNAGYGSFGAIEDVPLEEARRQFEVNLFGAARLIALALPTMRARRSGTIVNVTSMGEKIYEPFGGWYHATKFALEGLSDCLRLELASTGVRVVVVEPGGVKTEWSGIAARSLIDRSGSTAYAEEATRWARLLSRGDDVGSEPAVIADAIVRAVRARKPKTRYVAGAFAVPMLAARRVLPDRAFDSMMMLMGRTARPS